MAFKASWQWAFAAPFVSLKLTGDARRYLIDWGDGSSATLFDPAGTAGPYLFEEGHRYQDGTYTVSISQGGRGTPRAVLSAIVAADRTDDQDISGSRLSDYVIAGSGDDRIRGGGGDDLLFGGAGDDRITGGSSATGDYLLGGFGDDVLIGGSGADRLRGDNGRDRLSGGAGADTFVFIAGKSGGSNYYDPDQDTVLDFVQGEDLLDLSDLRAGRRAIEFIGENEFDGTNSRHTQVRFFIDEAGSTVIQGNVDGTSAVYFSIKLIGEYDLTASDFILA